MAAPAIAQGAWTWMGGSSTIGNGASQPGVYGTLGVPAPSNIPYSRVGASTWTDKAGHLWMFGGFTWNADIHNYWLNDLWEFDPSTSEWTWQAGSDTAPCSVIEGNVACGRPGVYGTQETAASGNVPGGRDSAVNWTDARGNLWLYGGAGFDSVGQLSPLDDLWEFDPSTKLWTWIRGHTTAPESGNGNAGTYGTLGVPDVANNPGGLQFANSWTDKDGNGWLFGGWGNDVNGINGLPNNLWNFDSSAGAWAWVEGSSTFSTPWIHPSVYGTLGQAASGNVPGTRWLGASWADTTGRLWLFGGQGYDSAGNSGFLNEMWEYDPSAGEWTWTAGQKVMTCGPNSQNQNCGNGGIYGMQGQPAPGNLPGGRTQPSFWTDKESKFWLFGGDGYDGKGMYDLLNDLWQFDPSTQEWTWIGGTQTGGKGIYGTLGVASASNLPGSRHAAATWTDADGNLWLFGGNNLDANGTIGLGNDFWKYQIASLPPPPPADFSVAIAPPTLTVQAGQSGSTTLTITPANGFNSRVSFACSGLPAGDSCTFSPGDATPSGGTVSVTITVNTAAPAAGARSTPGVLGPGKSLPVLALAAGLLTLGFRRSRRWARLLPLACALVCVLACASLLTGCASIHGLHGPPPAPVTSTVTVMATSGNLQHSAILTLTVD
jgi:N-acetylneuraminic acid mutarotase